MKGLLVLTGVSAICIFLNGNLWAQSGVSPYQNLEVQKFYLYPIKGGNGAMGATAIGKASLRTCTPCILKYYSKKNVLLEEGVFYTDCGVGWFKEYYDNGKLKVAGQYLETDWNAVSVPAYCGKKTGEWIYYDNKGQKVYSEYWKDDSFLRQQPEQKKTEVWGTALSINGKIISDDMPLTIAEANKVKVSAKFKNSSRDSLDIMLELRVSSGTQDIGKTYLVCSLDEFDFEKSFQKAGIPAGTRAIVDLRVTNFGKTIGWYSLSVDR